MGKTTVSGLGLLRCVQSKLLICLVLINWLDLHAAAGAGFEEDDLPEGAFTFFNVGQGHSTLVTSKGRPPLLCDAGTLQYEHFASSRDEIVKPIVEAIQASHRTLDPEVYGNTLPLSVVLSHGDEDHYSLIYDIVRILNNFSTTSRLSVRMVIGGELSEYDSRRVSDPFEDLNIKECVISGAKEELNTLKRKAWLTYQAEGDQSIISHILSEADLNIDWRDDKNAKSLVVRAAVKNWSAVLPGDATDRTTKEIIKFYKDRNEMQADILLASHHGAEDKCNSTDWISFINPKASVISAGQRKDWFHPRVEFIRRLITVANRNKKLRHDLPLHDLYYYGDKSYEPTFFQESRYMETYTRRDMGKSIVGQPKQPFLSMQRVLVGI